MVIMLRFFFVYGILCVLELFVMFFWELDEIVFDVDKIYFML